MGNTFSNMGHLNAVTELEKEMDSNTAPIHSPLKAFSLKVPEHVLESLTSCLKRLALVSALIVKLFEQYLGQATYDYLDGYNSLASHEKPIEVVISEDLDERLKASDLSDSAKQYLKNGLYRVAFEM